MNKCRSPVLLHYIPPLPTSLPQDLPLLEPRIKTLCERRQENIPLLMHRQMRPRPPHAPINKSDTHPSLPPSLPGTYHC